MKPTDPNRTTRALHPLILGLMIAACIIQLQAPAHAQDNPCFDGQEPRPGVFEAWLTGAPEGDALVLSIDRGTPSGAGDWAERGPANSNPIPTEEAILDRVNNEIVVPQGAVAVVWIRIESEPSNIRFAHELDSTFQPVSMAVRWNDEKGALVICDDNSGSADDHAWNFGVQIGEDWYDPQIENQGDDPPPP